MARVLRIAGIAALTIWVAWNTYRHVAVYTFRGRVVVVTDRVLGHLVVGAGVLAFAASPSLLTAAIAASSVAAAAALRWGQLWLIVGASQGSILDRGALVLRGMGFRLEGGGGRLLEERDGRIRVSILVRATPRIHVVRLRTAGGMAKVPLFRANFRKYLVAMPRQGRGAR